MKDSDRLDDVLAQWTPRPSDRPDFAATVQAAVDAEPTARVMRFPALFPLAAAAAVALGLYSGLSVNRHQYRADMADAYARSIDPVHMTGVTPLPSP